MIHELRCRFWLECILGLITGIMAVVTLIWHNWIEVIFRVDPDKGSGSGEWLVVLLLLCVTATLAAAARLEWRQTKLPKPETAFTEAK